MRTAAFHVLTIAACFALLSAGANAHHSYVTKYDPKQKITFRGVITSVSYFNPHIFFTVSVKNRDGGQTEWRIETESVQMTRARGLTKAALVVGKHVMISGWRARTGGAELGMSGIKFAKGGWLNMRTRPR